MTNNRIHGERNNNATNILVLGDWVVDEHWLVGIHRSRTSTRVGQAHYRSIQNFDSTISALCGAGRTAGILSHAHQHKDHAFKVIGVGLWHPGDTHSLESMLDPVAVKGHTPHQIELTYSTADRRTKLVNLIAPGRDPEPGTTKVIRLYQQTGSAIKLVERIDWELKPPERGWFSRKDLINHQELKKILAANKPTAIVVQDLLKGVISADVIEFLIEQLPEADWFLSSKDFRPKWREKIPAERIKLIEIPEAATRHALETRELDSWTTKQGIPSKAALTLLDKLGEEFPNAMLVAVFNDRTVLAHRRKLSEKQGAFWVNRQPDGSPVELPMASVCFATFTANVIVGDLAMADASNGTLAVHPPLEKLVDYSLSFTQEWRTFMRGRLETPLEWEPAMEPQLDVSAAHTPTVHSTPLRWSDDLKKWNASYNRLGIITENGKQHIELWRAMTEVKNYICIAASKRKILRKILDELEAFKTGRARSCMMIAAPGSGKSLLARVLAEDHGLCFLEFNITQMISKNDLLDCFDVILTTQFENPSRRLLVFVDEIDAYLGGEPVYDAFLAPLESGVYRRAGKTFPIEPCFWLFAGTKDPTEQADARKARDFVSRLTLKPVAMKMEENDAWQLENVYLGVTLLRLEFPDVREVSTVVLEVFHNLSMNLSIRELRQFIKDFVDIRSGEVRWSNVPQNWYQRLGIRDHGPLTGEIMVEIRGEPGSPASYTGPRRLSVSKGAKAAA
jgi:ATPase family associated with various cellular activities (AAA)